MRVYTCECKVILGVDRLDYTKGLISRLKSFQRFLVKYPKWIGKVLLLQVLQCPSHVKYLREIFFL